MTEQRDQLQIQLTELKQKTGGDETCATSTYTRPKVSASLAPGETISQEGISPEASPRIYTHCPACGNDTLTINKGHLLCTWHECPEPTLIDKGPRVTHLPTPATDALPEANRATSQSCWNFWISEDGTHLFCRLNDNPQVYYKSLQWPWLCTHQIPGKCQPLPTYAAVHLEQETHDNATIEPPYAIPPVPTPQPLTDDGGFEVWWAGYEDSLDILPDYQLAKAAWYAAKSERKVGK